MTDTYAIRPAQARDIGDPQPVFELFTAGDVKALRAHAANDQEARLR